MKQRILTGWNVIRVLYLLAGVMIIFQSVAQQQWIGIVLGGYFAMMGLFAFGCAAGNCFGSNCAKPEIPGKKSNIKEVEFEEIK